MIIAPLLLLGSVDIAVKFQITSRIHVLVNVFIIMHRRTQGPPEEVTCSVRTGYMNLAGVCDSYPQICLRRKYTL